MKVVERVWTKRGPHQTLYDGQVFYLLDPKPEEVHVHHIAHGLSRTNRFAGQLNCEYYYVNQHQTLVGRVVEGWLVKDHGRILHKEHWDIILIAHLHDAPETYIGDMISPLKYEIPQFREVEDKISNAIYDKFGLPHGKPDIVHKADKYVMAIENRDLRGIIMPEYAGWIHDEPKIVPLDSYKTQEQWLKRFNEIQSYRKINE